MLHRLSHRDAWPIAFAAAALLAATDTSVNGQWMDFADELDARLSLSSVPPDDGEEKDIAVGDFNLDGWDDVVVVRKKPFSDPGPRSDMLLINESGVLCDRTTELAPGFLLNLTDARDVIVGDFNSDGWPDLIIANTRGDQPRLYINQCMTDGVWQGLADESAARLPHLTPPNQPDGPEFCAVCVGDIDSDDDLDIYFVNYIHGEGTTDILLVNNGSGVFTDETQPRMGDHANVAFGTSAEMHDVDQDGDLDILKMSTLYSVDPFNSRGTFILYNDGNGVFNSVPYTQVGSDAPYMFSAGYFDDNEMLDIYFVDDGIDACAFATEISANGPLAFDLLNVAPSPRTLRFGGNIHTADVDNDGDLDIGVCPIDVEIQNCGGIPDELTLLRNDGQRQLVDPYEPEQSPIYGLEAHDFAFVDINNDGCLDLFLGLCSGYGLFMQTACQPDMTAVVISLPTGPPTELNREHPTSFAVRLRPGVEIPIGGSLYYGIDDGPMQSTPLVAIDSVSGDMYHATFPALPCGLAVRYYVQADGDGGGDTTRPAIVPDMMYEAIVGAAEVIFQYDFEGDDDDGWGVNLAGTDDATTGIWERVDPVGTGAQPENDVDSDGTDCWVTGQHTGGGVGGNDIDGGTTTLSSPLLDLSGYGDARLVYSRWYSNAAGSNPGEDVLRVQINDGSGWVLIEQVGPDAASDQQWKTMAFDLGGLISMTDGVQLRFVASDLNNPSVVEAAIDRVRIEGLPCTGACPGDATGDYQVDLLDLLAVIRAWGTDDPDAADLNGDDVVDVGDLLMVLMNWANSC